MYQHLKLQLKMFELLDSIATDKVAILSNKVGQLIDLFDEHKNVIQFDDTNDFNDLNNVESNECYFDRIISFLNFNKAKNMEYIINSYSCLSRNGIMVVCMPVTEINHLWLKSINYTIVKELKFLPENYQLLIIYK